jgi:hypothetical protein
MFRKNQKQKELCFFSSLVLEVEDMQVQCILALFTMLGQFQCKFYISFICIKYVVT